MPAPLPPPLALRQLLIGNWHTQMIYAAAKLGLADLLRAGPRPVAELATATKTHTRTLYRLLRGLASLGVFVEQIDGRFANTPLSECLMTAPGSQRALAVMIGEEHYRAWAELIDSVRTGGCAFEKVFGENIFAYLSKHPEQGAIFDEAMTGVHGVETSAMLDAYDFTSIGTLVDVGGGNGRTLAGVLQRYPTMKGILFDMPRIVERARSELAAAGVTDRCQVVGGDFFQSVPPGGDAYMMRHIIHDWDEDRCRTILRNCRAVMPSHGKLLVVEVVIPTGNDANWGKLLDLNMLVMPGGAERTEAEYRELFAATGFQLKRVVPTIADVSVVEGVPA
jgi:O-methyltransferase domain/Dimerisation domain